RGPSESLRDSKIDENALASSAHNKQGHTPIFALRHNKQGHTPIFALGKPWKKLGQKKLQKTGTDTIIQKTGKNWDRHNYCPSTSAPPVQTPP
ncbi:hypothetical protein, partial [Maricaulis sp.]|uniref:hypothetical protein n=1 Tax=Maricaulis sp. TaxID=1486257 RepID=UPI002617563A